MNLINVENLCKGYDKFHLKNVSFSLDEGYIMGFIGSNGAGKTTTLKGMLNIIKPDSGKVTLFDKDIIGNEITHKQNIAFMMGGIDYYPKRKLKTISSVVSPFYTHWDNNTYDSYLKRFNLDSEKRVGELSQGMRVKFALTLALSHNAKLIILDEPTSGLDPVARDNLLELFQELVEEGNRSILFSTHITSDLEKCADYITFIDKGKIIESTSMDYLLDSYRIISGSKKDLNLIEKKLISLKENSFGFQGLIKTKVLNEFPEITGEIPSLDDIMIYYSKREEKYV